jgi:hypothetical protein
MKSFKFKPIKLTSFRLIMVDGEFYDEVAKTMVGLTVTHVHTRCGKTFNISDVDRRS